MKKPSQHVQVLLALLSSVLFSFAYNHFQLDLTEVERGLKGTGEAFFSALQLGAIPFIFCSLSVSVGRTRDADTFARVGKITLILYFATTVFAAFLGLFFGNLLQAGKYLLKTGWDDFKVVESPEQQGDVAWPNNLFALFSKNSHLAYALILSILFGFSLRRLEENKREWLLTGLDACREALVGVVNYIMRLAPLGIFCLITSRLLEITKTNPDKLKVILQGVGVYMLSSIGCLTVLFLLYPLAVTLYTKVGFTQFFRAMWPAQVAAFTTSSSTAVLHKTKEQVGKLNVSEKIRNFVLSLGASINMDGTVLYQSFTILFVTQMFGYSLDWTTQLRIASYVSFSSLGLGGVPGGSLVTTSLLLHNLQESISMTSSEVKGALSLIFLSDRLLDMLRTVNNITGDAAVTVIVQEKENMREAKKE